MAKNMIDYCYFSTSQPYLKREVLKTTRGTRNNK